MNEGRQYQIGERISCACGAAYQFWVEGRRIVKKDDALSVLSDSSCCLAAGSVMAGHRVAVRDAKAPNDVGD